jgi:hypothetical protein
VSEVLLALAQGHGVLGTSLLGTGKGAQDSGRVSSADINMPVRVKFKSCCPWDLNFFS